MDIPSNTWDAESFTSYWRKKMGATNHRTEIHIYAKLGKLEPYMPPSAARARREKRWEGEEAMTHHAADVPLWMGGG